MEYVIIGIIIVVIAGGAKITDSKAMKGAVRGTYHGTDGVRGHYSNIQFRTKH